MIAKPNNINQQSALLPYVPGPSTYSAEINFFQSVFPLQFSLISGATATVTTPIEFNVLGRNFHAIQTSGTFSASVLVEATLDGTNWFTLDTITTATIKQYTGLYQSLRVSIPSLTSGSVTVTGITQRS